MFSGSTIARAMLLLVAAAAAVGLYSVYGSHDDNPAATPAAVQPEPSVEAPKEPDPPAARAEISPPPPEPEPVRPPDPPPAPTAPQEVAPAPGQAEAQPAPAAAAAETPAAAATSLVDLNNASVAELNKLGTQNKLKGVPAFSRAIVKNRPYGTVDDLLKKKVVSKSKFERIKDQVTVR